MWYTMFPLAIRLAAWGDEVTSAVALYCMIRWSYHPEFVTAKGVSPLAPGIVRTRRARTAIKTGSCSFFILTISPPVLALHRCKLGFYLRDWRDVAVVWSRFGPFLAKGCSEQDYDPESLG